MTFEDFEEDKLRQNAIIRKLEIIGEAAKNLPPDFKKKHGEVSWQQMAGMRDKLIHHYFGLNLKRVWAVLEKDLPELKVKIQRLL